MLIMKLAIAFLLFILSVPPGQARLGETYKELKRRYGQTLDAEADKEAGADHYTFRWERYVVKVTVQGGTSVSEEFTREDRREFTAQEVQELLVESSDPGLAWIKVDGSTWKQRDRIATWSARSLVVDEKARRR